MRRRASDELEKSLRTWRPKPLDVEKLKEEMGDALSCWAAICAEVQILTRTKSST